MITLTKKEVLNVNSAIGAVAGCKGLDIAFFYTKNKRVLKENVDIINKEIDKIQKGYDHVEEKLKEFSDCHQKLIDKYTKKDKDGNLMKVTSNKEITDPEALDKEFNELKSVEFKETFEEKEKAKKELDDHLEKKVQIDLKTIKKDKLPSDITGQQLEGIMCIVQE